MAESPPRPETSRARAAAARAAAGVALTLALAAAAGACRPDDAPEAAPAVARAALAPAPVISPEIGTDTPVTGFNPGSTSGAAAAFGTSSYLVVWVDRRADAYNIASQSTYGDIYGIRMAADGTVLDTTSFPIAVAGGEQTGPMVTFDGTNWVVVWGDGRDPSGMSGTWGARVAQDGTVLDPGGFVIEPGTTYATANSPVGLDFDGTHVVVTLTRSSGIYADVIQSNGTPLGGAFQVAPSGSGGGALAFDGMYHLVLFGQPATPTPPSGYNTAVVAQRFTSAGTLIGSPTTLLTTSGTNASPAGMPTTVVSSGNGNGWLVGFILGATIRYSLVGDNGAPGSLISLGGSGAGITADADGAGYTLIYTTPTTYHARRMNTAGFVSVADQILFPSSQSAGTMALAHDPSGEILAYGSSNNLFATHLSSSLATPDAPPGILLSRTANLQADPSVAWNGSEYLVAWNDFRMSTNGSTFYATYATRVSPAGQVLDTAGLMLLLNASRTALGSNGATFMLAATSYQLVALAVSAAGATGGSANLTANGSAGTPVSHVASDGTNYLVAWVSGTGVTGTGPLVGTRLGPNAEALDVAPIAIAPSAIALSVAVAFNGTSYLVAYEQPSGAIAAVRVDKNGQLVGTSATTIAMRTSNETNLAVASDGSGWLIAWTDTGKMRAARVDASGQLRDPSAIAVSSSTASGPVGAAWDGRRYWVIWTDTRHASPVLPQYGLLEVYGARVSSGGAVDDPGGILISGGHDHLASAVAGGDHQILVAYYRMMAEQPYGIYRVRERLVTDLSPDGESCAKAADCQSNICNGTCQPVPTGSGGATGSGGSGSGGSTGSGGATAAGAGGSGAGGATAAGAGGSGAGGAIGAGGSAGSGAGGAGATGGSSGTGSAGAVGGATGGAGGTGGAVATGGATGAAGSAGATGGAAGAGGKPDAGSSGGHGAAGATGTADADADAPAMTGGSGGCSCSTGGDAPHAGSALLAALSVGLVLRSRRRRRRGIAR
jgi:MYXO-CTERM domain-containing protein